MNALAVQFEVFDPGDVAEFGALSRNSALKQACDAAYQQGYRDGESAASSERIANDAAVLARIAEAADDLCVTNSEARAAVVQSLRPLIDRITRSVLPACARAGLAREIADVVTELAGHGTAETLQIHVGPDQEHAVSAAIETAGVAAKVYADPQITGLRARVGVGDGWEQLDLEDAAKAAHRVAEDFFDAAQEGLRNVG